MKLRPAIPGDVRLLFDWVNQPDSLASKLETSGPIPWPEHEAWFAGTLAEPSSTIWIIEVDGKAAGQLRVFRNDRWIDVDIYLAQSYRGRGLAQAALSAGIDMLLRAGAPARLRARVKNNNTASQKLFERAGFDRQATAADHVVYVLNAGRPSGGRT